MSQNGKYHRTPIEKVQVIGRDVGDGDNGNTREIDYGLLIRCWAVARLLMDPQLQPNVFRIHRILIGINDIIGIMGD